MKHASELANRCQGLARNLSYNGEGIEAATKYTLREASYFIDSQIVRVHKKKGGLLMVTARGHSRYMTWRERIAYWLLRGRTEISPSQRDRTPHDTAIAGAAGEKD